MSYRKKNNLMDKHFPKDVKEKKKVCVVFMLLYSKNIDTVVIYVHIYHMHVIYIVRATQERLFLLFVIAYLPL